MSWSFRNLLFKKAANGLYFICILRNLLSQVWQRRQFDFSQQILIFPLGKIDKSDFIQIFYRLSSLKECQKYEELSSFLKSEYLFHKNSAKMRFTNCFHELDMASILLSLKWRFCNVAVLLA